MLHVLLSVLSGAAVWTFPGMGQNEFLQMSTFSFLLTVSSNENGYDHFCESNETIQN